MTVERAVTMDWLKNILDGWHMDIDMDLYKSFASQILPNIDEFISEMNQVPENMEVQPNEEMAIMLQDLFFRPKSEAYPLPAPTIVRDEDVMGVDFRGPVGAANLEGQIVALRSVLPYPYNIPAEKPNFTHGGYAGRMLGYDFDREPFVVGNVEPEDEGAVYKVHSGEITNNFYGFTNL